MIGRRAFVAQVLAAAGLVAVGPLTPRRRPYLPASYTPSDPGYPPDWFRFRVEGTRNGMRYADWIEGPWGYPIGIAHDWEVISGIYYEGPSEGVAKVRSLQLNRGLEAVPFSWAAL